MAPQPKPLNPDGNRRKVIVTVRRSKCSLEPQSADQHLRATQNEPILKNHYPLLRHFDCENKPSPYCASRSEVVAR